MAVTHKRGYPNIVARIDCESKTFRVNRLVALAFLDNPLGKPEVNHKDGNKRNNAVSNLEWATRSENELHAFATGLKTGPRGSRQGRSRLVEADVVEIVSRLRVGRGVGELAREFGVHQSTISDIKLGRSWAHLVGAGGVS